MAAGRVAEDDLQPIAAAAGDDGQSAGRQPPSRVTAGLFGYVNSAQQTAAAHHGLAAAGSIGGGGDARWRWCGSGGCNTRRGLVGRRGCDRRAAPRCGGGLSRVGLHSRTASQQQRQPHNQE